MYNTKVQKWFFYIMLLVMAANIAVPGIRFLSLQTPQAVQGTLDLSNWDGLKDKTVSLNGEWEFYFGQLLTPEDFQTRQPAGKTWQKVPAKWNSYQIEDEVPAHGSATYRLTILLPVSGGDYGIKTTCISASARIFADGREIIVCGNPGDTPASTEHEYYADTGYFSVSGDQIEILVQAANYLNVDSGIRYEIHFGSQKAIASLRLYHFFIDAALISGLFFMSIYFFGLGLQRKRNREVLFFASYCLFSAIYAGTCSEALLNYVWPSLSYNVSVKILTFSLILSLYSLVKYVYYAFKVSFSRRTNLITDGITLAFILLTCFTNFYLSQYAFFILFLGNIYALCLLFHIIFRHIHTNIEGRYYLYTAMVSSVILLITSLCDITLQLESHLFLPVFQPVFIMSLALYMSEKYETSYKTIESLSARLAAADKLKDDFLAKTSHELKTPLNGIINISPVSFGRRRRQLNCRPG